MDLDQHRRIINKGNRQISDCKRARNDTYRYPTRPGAFAVNCGLGPFKGSRASRSRGRDAGRNAAESLAIESQLSQFQLFNHTFRRASRRFFLVWVLT